MKPLEKPPEWEGDDSINAPKGLKKVTDEDIKDAVDHDDEEDDDDV